MSAPAPETTPTVHGQTVDDQTRCVHYRSAVDVVAIQFHCCRRFYPCYQCHAQAEPHPATQWPADEWGHPAILCGVCRATISIRSYQAIHACPRCTAPFNDACALHADFYFAGREPDPPTPSSAGTPALSSGPLRG
jgi:uncharacterized CHY-type Zn-finger protein